MTIKQTLSSQNFLGKISIGVLIAFGLTGQACGGDDETSGDGDGDGETATGGTTNVGTGGTSGVGGTPPTGTGGTTITPPGPGVAVDTPIPAGSVTVTEGGYGEDADSGFKGYFFTTADKGGSVINELGPLSELEVTEGKVCANGTAAKVVGEAYSTTWGAQVGWNLNQTVDGADAESLDISGTVGLTFTIEAAVPASMRLQVAVGTDYYCTTIEAGQQTVRWTDLTLACWDAGGEAFDPATQEVTAVAWSVPTNATSAVPFDFCIGGITVDLEGDVGGGGAGGAGGGNGN